MAPALALILYLIAHPPAGPGASAPFLAPARGGLLLSWLEPVSATKRAALRFARFHDGAWSAPATIVERDDLVVNWADCPSIVEDANGVLFAHWLQTSGAGAWASDVRVAVSKDGGRHWSAPLLLNRDGKQPEHGFVTMAALPRGGVGATWLDGREGAMSLRYATIDANGVVRNDVQLDPRTCECCTTGMAMTARGALIVYRDRSAGEVRDIAAVRETGRGWSAPRLVHADGWKIAGCPVNGPQADARGERVAVAWFTAAGERARVLVAFSSDGGATFSAPIAVDDGKPAGRVDVVMTGDDAALVTWIEQTAGGAELRARRVARSGAIGPSINVAESSTARAAGFARAAVSGGATYVAWKDQTSIRVARLEAP